VTSYSATQDIAPSQSAWYRLAAVLLVAVPPLDRAVPSVSVGVAAVSLTDAVVLVALAAVVLDSVWMRRAVVPTRVLGWSVALTTLTALFLLGEIRYYAEGTGLRQAISLALSGSYVLAIVFIARGCGMGSFTRPLLWIATINGGATILAGLFPNALGFLATRLHPESHSRAIWGIALPFRRTAGFFHGYEYNAIYLYAGMACALGYHARSPRLRYPAAVAVMVAGGIVTQSRSTWIGIILFAFCWAYYAPMLRPGGMARSAFARAALLTAAAAAAVPLFYLLRAFIGMNEKTYLARLYLSRLALEMVQDTPLLGRGYGSFASTGEKVVHNMFILVLYGTGLVGLLILMIVVFAPFVWVGRTRDRAWAWALAAPTMFAASTASALSFYSLWLVIGLVLAAPVASHVAPGVFAAALPSRQR
jgi:hypothetical protein